MNRSRELTRDPATPLWIATITLRVLTFAFAVSTVIVYSDGYQRPWLAWTVLAVMGGWTACTSFVYAQQSRRWTWFVVVDVLLTISLMLTSPWVLSASQYVERAALITTVWVSGAVAVAGARFGWRGGAVAGLAMTIGTATAQKTVDVDVVRDGVLLVAAGLLIGASAQTARRSQARLAYAMRAEAATAERERLARSIHDSVLQVLARVRRRGADLGGEASELARLAGEQEIALRALVSTEPVTADEQGSADLRSALQLLATSKVQVSAPAGEVRLPASAVIELAAAVKEALLNVDKHAGPDARAWVLLEDLGGEVVVSVRDDGPGIPSGRLADAAAQGHMGVAKSIKGRVADLGGTISLDTAPGSGTEWELKVPVRTKTRTRD